MGSVGLIPLLPPTVSVRSLGLIELEHANLSSSERSFKIILANLGVSHCDNPYRIMKDVMETI
jgi:hypothetical protein